MSILTAVPGVRQTLQPCATFEQLCVLSLRSAMSPYVIVMCVVLKKKKLLRGIIILMTEKESSNA